MTENDITKIANKISKIIIDHLEAKQDEWNNEFNLSMENIKQDGFGNLRMMSDKELYQIQIDDLQVRLDKAVDSQDFKLASELNNQIIYLKNKL